MRHTWLRTIARVSAAMLAAGCAMTQTGNMLAGITGTVVDLMSGGTGATAPGFGYVAPSTTTTTTHNTGVVGGMGTVGGVTYPAGTSVPMTTTSVPMTTTMPGGTGGMTFGSIGNTFMPY